MGLTPIRSNRPAFEAADAMSTTTMPAVGANTQAPGSSSRTSSILQGLPRFKLGARKLPNTPPLDPRLAAQLAALDRVARTPPGPSIPVVKLVSPKTLETIALDCGVAVHALEAHLKERVHALCERSAFSNTSDWAAYRPLMDTLYNLFLLGQHGQSPAWLRQLQSFDAFVAHFCPQANRRSQAELMSAVKVFMRIHLPLELQQQTPAWAMSDFGPPTPVYRDPQQWIALPDVWTSAAVIAEARQLLKAGYPKPRSLFVHGTGSAVLPSIAKNQGLWSAAKVIGSGGAIVSGEFVTDILSSDGQTSKTGGASGHGNVFTSREGLQSTDYTTLRWFDEMQITFGISAARQQAYNEALGIRRNYDNSGEGIEVGPVVPLENVVAISAAKADEARVRAWIGAHCPHVQFVSYEAAALLESEDLQGLLRPKEE